MIIRWKYRVRAVEGEASPLEKDSWSGETGRRSDPTNACIRAGADKDAEQRSGSRESSSQNVSEKMTFPNDGTCVVEKQYSNEEILAVLAESRQARKHLRKLGKVTETVAAYRPKELKHLQAVEKLATWRRACDFDRLAEDDDSWIHGTHPPTPEEFTASLWCDLKELENAIYMPVRDGSWQRAKRFIHKPKQGIVSLSDEEFAMLKRFVDKRDRNAAHMTVAPADATQYRSSRSPTPEISSDVHVCMEENEEGMVDPERDQLKPLSTSTDFETPGQQGHPSWETGRTTAAGCLPAGVSSNLGGNTSSPTERVTGKRAGTATTPVNSSKTPSLQVSRKPEDKEKSSEENKQYDPGGKGEKPPPWNAAVMVLFSFLGGTLGHGCPVACASCFFCLCVPVC